MRGWTDTKEIAKLKQEEADELRAAFGALDPERRYRNRETFLKDLKSALASRHLKLTPAQLKAVLLAFAGRDETADICADGKGKPEPDPELRDTENVPLKEDINAYFAREVKPHVADAWIDEDKTRIGYEIPFNRHFYTYTPPRPLGAIDADLQAVSRDIMELLTEITG